jgi:glycosyltransferase involved in cell wall biosynthesis
MHVLRLCSSFEAPPTALTGAGVRFNPVGGVQNHTAQLTRALDRRGVEQTVVTSRPPTARHVERVGRAARVIRLGLPTPRWRQLYALPAAAVVPVAGRGADVVHVHVTIDLGIVPIAVATARLHGLPLVITIHASLRHTLLVEDRRTARIRALGGGLESWVARRADAVITLTPRLAALLASDGVPADRLHVISSGVTPEEFAGPFADPLPGVARPRVLYVGRLEPEKDVATLVRAFGMLRAPGARLVLVGDGSQRAPLRRLADELGLGPRVTMPGYVPHDRVPAFLAHADALVLPSRFEELGSVLLEGMHMGVPVVASDTGGITAAVGHEQAGLLVPPEQPARFAAALERVLGDPALARRLGEEGRRRTRAVDWNHLAGRTLDVYEAVAGGKAGRHEDAGPSRPPHARRA